MAISHGGYAEPTSLELVCLSIPEDSNSGEEVQPYLWGFSRKRQAGNSKGQDARLDKSMVYSTWAFLVLLHIQAVNLI